MTNLKISDIAIIAVLIVVAAIVVYLLSPLIIAVVIIGIAYFVYRWYTNYKRTKRYA
jgi:Flp pilus assembly protein TadB